MEGQTVATVVDVAKEREMGAFRLANRYCYIRRHLPSPRTGEGVHTESIETTDRSFGRGILTWFTITFDEDMLDSGRRP